ncbi:MAG TPA: sugar nucleotide-binding protein [Bacteroidales bacterium]|nr:sugar nucleotide-binding protein [Bacteroidales bacterium]HSA43409.1 sugar nucleotide-binding protein [Bacteroidales bacterium]
MNKEIIIIGADSFIGGHLFPYLLTEYSCSQISGTWFHNQFIPALSFLDITDDKSLESFITEHPESIFIILSGNKDVRFCEMNPEAAYSLNTKPIETIVSVIQKNDFPAKVLFMSSDYVFDGTEGNYSEAHLPNPMTVYGKTKYSAEKILLNSSIQFKIIRSSAVMGYGGVFFDWLMRELLTKEGAVSLFSNTYFSPTPLELLCKGLNIVIQHFSSIEKKILHLCGSSRMSRYEFGCIAADYFKINKDRLLPVEADFIGSTFQNDLSMKPGDLFAVIEEIGPMDYFAGLFKEAQSQYAL